MVFNSIDIEDFQLFLAMRKILINHLLENLLLTQGSQNFNDVEKRKQRKEEIFLNRLTISCILLKKLQTYRKNFKVYVNGCYKSHYQDMF